MNALQKAFRGYISTSDRSPGVIDKGEAETLIKIAKQINAKNSGCCRKSHKGYEQLEELFTQNKDVFETDAAQVVERQLWSDPDWDFHYVDQHMLAEAARRRINSMTPEELDEFSRNMVRSRAST